MLMKFEENKWIREEDARTLARAEEIKADTKRYIGAVLESQNMFKESVERVKGLAKVAGKAKDLPRVKPVGRRNPATLGSLNDIIEKERNR